MDSSSRELPFCYLRLFRLTEPVNETKETKEETDYWRHALAIFVTPILLYAFIQLENIAKGLTYHDLSKFFVEIMFAAFIPLAIGTILLLYSQLSKDSSKLKYISYFMVVLALTSTLFVAHSVVTVPRGGYQSSYSFSTDTFAGELTRTRSRYEFESNQTVFTRDYPISMALVRGDYDKWSDGMEIRIQTSATNLSGTLYFSLELYHLTGRIYVPDAVYFNQYQASVDLEESQPWTGNIWFPEVYWGDDHEDRRMRLEGYRFVCRLWLRLEGSDQGEVIPIDVDVSGKFYLIDFRVDSALQNGMATFACGVFAGFHALILAIPLIRQKVRK